MSVSKDSPDPNVDTDDPRLSRLKLQQALKQNNPHFLSSITDNINRSLKRTESKMDDGQMTSMDDVEYESETQDAEWQRQGRSTQRSYKAQRTDTFVHGRTNNTYVHDNDRTDKNPMSHRSAHEAERKEKEKQNMKLSNLNECQSGSNNNMHDAEPKTNNENESERHVNGHPDEVHISRQALKFAVDNRLPPIKIQCAPPLANQDACSTLIKELLKHFEKKFKKLNPKFNQPLGFEHFTLDNTGTLVCFTNYIELFVYMCDVSNYPKELMNIKIQPILPTKLPARNAVILKFIDNKIKIEDVRTAVEERIKSVYSIDEMIGTKTYRSRHIRVDILCNKEYLQIINGEKFVISGHLYEVEEYLPAPKVLICSQCNSPGHMKKNCKSTTEVCRRCGKDRKDGAEHKTCVVKCHHCGDEHEATSYRCPTISKYREQLLRQLKNNTHLLPPQTQFFIPQQFRDGNKDKILTNKAKARKQPEAANVPAYMHQYNPQEWPALSSNTFQPPSNTTFTVWNTEIKKLNNELNNLKKEYDTKVETLTQEWQLIKFQIKSHAEAIAVIYDSTSEILSAIAQAMNMLNDTVKLTTHNAKDDNEEHRKEAIHETVKNTMNFINTRLLALSAHHQGWKTIMAKQNDLAMRGTVLFFHPSND